MKNSNVYWAIWSILLFYLALLCADAIPYPSTEFLTYLSVFEFLFASYFFYAHPSLKFFGLAHVHFIYAAMGAFAVGWVYYIIGADYVQYNTVSTGDFIDRKATLSAFYAPALVISMLALHFYPLGCFLGIKSNKKSRVIGQNDKRSANAIAVMGLILLAVSALSFVFLMLIGVFSINMNYGSYRLILDSYPFLHLVIVFYSVGICSVVACGGKKQQRLGWALFGFVAFLYFATGNKGEVLYALLSVIGVLIYKGMKIDWRLIASIVVLAFVVIPFISTSRSEGVLSGKTDVTMNFTGVFIEIGTQIRCTVLLLEQFAHNARDFIWGYSYYSPILNILDYIIPGMRMDNPASFDFKESFPGMGFNQIAEGYANFGIFGAITYFLATGLFLGKNESMRLSLVRLGFIGCICSELINVSRNKFAFFWGHILIIYLLYIAVLFLVNKKSKLK